MSELDDFVNKIKNMSVEEMYTAIKQHKEEVHKDVINDKVVELIKYMKNYKKYSKKSGKNEENKACEMMQIKMFQYLISDIFEEL